MPYYILLLFSCTIYYIAHPLSLLRHLFTLCTQFHISRYIIAMLSLMILLMLYCISVRLFDSSIPCRLTVSLFLYIPIYYAYSCILSFQHYHSIVISFSRLKSIAISVIPRIFLQILCNIRKWSQESLSDFLEPV